MLVQITYIESFQVLSFFLFYLLLTLEILMHIHFQVAHNISQQEIHVPVTLDSRSFKSLIYSLFTLALGARDDIGNLA